MKSTCQEVRPVIGRILLSMIFVMSAVNKVLNWDKTIEKMTSEGMEFVPVLLLGAIAFEFFGGLSVALGCWARLGACMLIVFLIPTTLIFHDFWTYEGQQQQMQMINFMKNLAILGGLFLVLGRGAGSLSVDARSSKTETSTARH